MSATPTFRCGHPKTPENSITGIGVDRKYSRCRFCDRMRRIVRKVEVGQERINAGLPTDRRRTKVYI